VLEGGILQLCWTANPQCCSHEPLSMEKLFDGRVALITGGASGIGRIAARAFADERASVVVSDSAAEPGEETARMIAAAGGKAIFVQADVTKSSEVKALIAEIQRAYGRLDFAFNNAGIDGVRAATADYPEDIWAQVLDVNVTGVFLCMKYEIPLMLRSQGAAIVNMASVAGVTGFPAYCAYAASKHAVIGLTKTAALDYAKSGLRVNALCPAYTRTPMLERVLSAKSGLEAKLLGRVPLGRMGTPEEIAAAAIYLCSQNAAFITGHALVMDGGIMAE
jgi:NAD(P)-dependent dehydrogenase (short-subunit alcohol dehydrogenase family)